MVRHSHFLVQGKKVSIPSYLVKVGQMIELREKSRKIAKIGESLEGVARRGVPSWLELEKEQFRGRLVSLPSREDLTMPIKEQLIVELYSK
jgi:small subunit ribosomal protein S4